MEIEVEETFLLVETWQAGYEGMVLAEVEARRGDSMYAHWKSWEFVLVFEQSRMANLT
jgi:hypothetical protein